MKKIIEAIKNIARFNSSNRSWGGRQMIAAYSNGRRGRMKIAKESWILIGIGVADLISTIVFIQHHGAQEANPLFRHYWKMGVPAFVVAKLVCLLGPILVMEWARQRNPGFVRFALRTAIASYIFVYGVGFMRLNSHTNDAQAATNITPVTAAQQMNIELTAMRWNSHLRRITDGGTSLSWRSIALTASAYHSGRLVTKLSKTAAGQHPHKLNHGSFINYGGFHTQPNGW